MNLRKDIIEVYNYTIKRIKFFLNILKYIFNNLDIIAIFIEILF